MIIAALIILFQKKKERKINKVNIHVYATIPKLLIK